MAYSSAMDFHWVCRARFATVLVAGVLAASCASSQPVAVDKYDQTWATSYADTTCTDWNSKMSEHQRWVAAADMLVNGRKTWGIDSMPADSLVDTFEDDLDQGCEPNMVSSDSITDIATGLLLIGGRDQYGS